MLRVAALFLAVATAGIWLAAKTSAAPASLMSCNVPEAHLRNMRLQISPDPPRPGQALTVVVEGDIDKSLSGGVISIALQAGWNQLPTIDVPFSTNGNSGEEHVKLTIGPFEFPSLSIPFVKTIDMNMEVKDQDGEQMLCVQGTLPVGKSAALHEPVLHGSVDDCSDDGYHVKNLHVESNPPKPRMGDSVTLSVGLDTDEAISGGALDIDVDFVGTTTKLDLHIPFALEPIIDPVTDFKVTIGPLDLPIIPNLRGHIGAVDQDGGGLACMNFDLPVMALLSV